MVCACRGQPGRRPGGSAAEAGFARLPAAPGGGGRPAARTRSGPSPAAGPQKPREPGRSPAARRAATAGAAPPAEPEGLRPSSVQTRKPTYLTSRARARIRARTAHARTPAHRRGKPRRFFHYSTGLALCNGDCEKSCKLFVNPIDNAEKVSTIIIVSTRSK